MDSPIENYRLINKISGFKWAIMDHNLEQVKKYVRELGANIIDSEGFSPIHYAIRHDDVEITKYLIMTGADVNAKTKCSKNAPLHIACFHRNLVIVKFLLSANDIDLNSLNEQGETPLSVAFKSLGFLEFIHKEIDCSIIRCLILAGSDVNIPDVSGNIPLHYACSLRIEDYSLFDYDDTRRNTRLRKMKLDKYYLVEVLLGHGSRNDVVNTEGNTPLDIAIQSNCEEFIELVKTGSDQDLTKGVYC